MDTFETIHARTSIRHFDRGEINNVILEKIVRAGMTAPTALNKQPWAFIVVTDISVKTQLAGKLPYAKMLHEASAGIIVCGDLSRAADGIDQEFWVQDCSAATQNILLAAKDLDLGAVWTAVYPVKERIEIVKHILQLPRHIVPLNVIPIGFSASDPSPKEKWNPDAIHWNKW